MLHIRHLLAGSALAACTVAAPAQSQYPQPAYGTAYAPLTDADQLAAQLRVVAANPTDLYALLNAAKLSLKVGDTDAAAALYSRAERVSPRHPQVQAGMARLLIQAGRPGAALRRFQDAERLGATLADFGPDRALAYDLAGEQARAQREYRALLQLGPDDETTRRYALSLGVSGLKEPALALLEPLNRRSDRGAWRARAFVLAMTGDRRGAEQIAQTMMPPGMAQGLNAFFDRLPKLSVADRAFAVNFGEVRTNPARVADARLVPPLPALSPEADPFPTTRAPVQVATVVVDDGKKKRKKPKKERPEPVRQASRSYTAPLPPPPAPTAIQLASLSSARMPATFASRGAGGRVTVLPPPPEAYRGPAERTATPTATQPDGDDEPDFAVAAVSSVAAANAPVTVVTRAAAPLVTNPAPAPLSTQASGQQPALPKASVPPPASSALIGPPAAVVTAGTAGATPATAVAAATEAPATGAPVPQLPTFALTPPASTAAAAITPATGAPPPPKGEPGDTVLAAILANIKVPDAELTPTAPPLPVGTTKLLTTVEKKAETKAAVAATRDGRTALAPSLPGKDARGRFVDPKGKPLLDARGRPLTERAAAAWFAKQPVATAKTDSALPAKDARGRFVDAKGKPLLDRRGRPLDAKAAAAWQLAQADSEPDEKLPRKDARGRFVDAKGKPLLDKRGRPLDAKAAAAWQVAQADDADTGKSKADPKLPPKDARGRFVDAKGKPLLDARGRPMTEKAAAAWKLADAKKKPDPAKTEPQRYWVQVASGANEATLDKAWGQAAGQAKSLKGKQGWTTPLRATNRVLTGPFKTSAEATAAVNQLKKEGVGAFMVTTPAGQKVTRLGGT